MLFPFSCKERIRELVRGRENFSDISRCDRLKVWQSFIRVEVSSPFFPDKNWLSEESEIER
jgi:hypothetical protein